MKHTKNILIIIYRDMTKLVALKKKLSILIKQSVLRNKRFPLHFHCFYKNFTVTNNR